MSNKLIGKLYEKRGDDRFDVVVDPTGDVVGITQFENGGLRSNSIDLFVESIPELVGLLQKAAGVETVEPEYEYSVQFALGGKRHPIPQWMSKGDAEAWLNEGGTSGVHDASGAWSKSIVKRRKAGKVEDV